MYISSETDVDTYEATVFLMHVFYIDILELHFAHLGTRILGFRRYLNIYIYVYLYTDAIQYAMYDHPPQLGGPQAPPAPRLRGAPELRARASGLKPGAWGASGARGPRPRPGAPKGLGAGARRPGPIWMRA